MNCRPSPNTVRGLVLLAVAACSDSTTPSQTDTPNQSPATPSLLTAASNSWTAKAPLPYGPNGVAAAIANDPAGRSILYVFGGHIEGGTGFGVQAYDLATDTWTAKATLTYEYNTNGIGKIGNKLYISGGFQIATYPIANAFLYAYDFAGDHLIKKAMMPKATSDGVSGVIQDKLYVLPGTCSGEYWPDPHYCNTEPFRQLFRYDPVTNAWSTRAFSPHYHTNGAGAVINGKFYVAGGFDASLRPTASLDVYDAGKNSWKTLANLPEARANIIGVNLQNKLYVLGGSSRRVYAYDPATNKWTAKASYPTDSPPGAAARVTLDVADYIVAVGGGGGLDGEPGQCYRGLHAVVSPRTRSGERTHVLPIRC